MADYLLTYKNADEDEEEKSFENVDLEEVLEAAAALHTSGCAEFKLYKLVSADIQFKAYLGDTEEDEEEDEEEDDEKAPVKRAPRKAAASDGRIKRSEDELEKLRTQILSFVASHAGCNAGDLAEHLDLDTKSLVLPIKQLLSEKMLRKTGKARGVKYFVKE